MEISTTGIASGFFFSKVPYPTSDTSQWKIGLCPDNRKTPETLRFRGILRLDTMYLAVLYLYN